MGSWQGHETHGFEVLNHRETVAFQPQAPKARILVKVLDARETFRCLASAKKKKESSPNWPTRTFVLEVEHIVERWRAVLLQLAAQLEQELLGEPWHAGRVSVLLANRK